jgi:hypothetical protein
MADAVEYSSVWRAHRATSSPISALCARRLPACVEMVLEHWMAFLLFVARVLFVNFVTCTLNSRFSRVVEAKGQRCNFCTHR